jgi:predicted Zn-dependent protease
MWLGTTMVTRMRSNTNKSKWTRLLQAATLSLVLQHAMPAKGSSVEMEKQAREYYQSGNKEESLALFEKIFKQQASFRNQHNLAYFHREFQSFIRAEALLLDLLEQQPQNVGVLLDIGTLYIFRHQSEKGIEFLRKAVTISPLNDYAVERLASAYFGIEQDRQARDVLHSYRATSNQFPRSHKVLIAMIEKRAENYSEAISIYRSLTKKSDSDVVYQLLLADAIGLVDQAKAQALFERLLKERPQRADIWASFAEFSQKTGASAQAIVAYQRAAQLTTKVDIALLSRNELLLLGDYYALARQPNRAKEVLEKGLSRYPWDTRFHTKLGWVYLTMDNIAAAETHFNDAYAAVPEDPYNSIALAELYRQRNMQAEYLRYESSAAQTLGSTNPEFARLLHDSAYQHGLRVAPSVGVSAMAGLHSSGQATDSFLRGFALTGSRQPLFVSERAIAAELLVAEKFGWLLQLGQHYIERSEDRQETDTLTEVSLSRVVARFLGRGDLTIRPGFKYSKTNEAVGGRKRTFQQRALQLDLNLYNSRWNGSFLAREGTDNPNYIEVDTRFSEVKFSIGQSRAKGASLFFSAAQQNNKLDNGIGFKTRTIQAGLQNDFVNDFTIGLLLRQVTEIGLKLPNLGGPKSHSLMISASKRYFNNITSKLEYEMAEGRGFSDFDRNRARVEFSRPIKLSALVSLSTGKASAKIPASIRFGFEHLDYSSMIGGDQSYAFLELEFARP